MTALLEKSRLTVDGLIARRHAPKSYEERVRHALDLIEMHLQEENPERIDECIRLYTDDAEWEAPARRVTYKGRETIKKMYLRVFNGVESRGLHRLFSRSCRYTGPVASQFPCVADRGC